jgi:hypothetical protein
MLLPPPHPRQALSSCPVNEHERSRSQTIGCAELEPTGARLGGPKKARAPLVMPLQVLHDLRPVTMFMLTHHEARSRQGIRNGVPAK